MSSSLPVLGTRSTKIRPRGAFGLLICHLLLAMLSSTPGPRQVWSKEHGLVPGVFV